MSRAGRAQGDVRPLNVNVFNQGRCLPKSFRVRQQVSSQLQIQRRLQGSNRRGSLVNSIVTLAASQLEQIILIVGGV